MKVESLKKANNLTGNKLSKRQKLVIPESDDILTETEKTDEASNKEDSTQVTDKTQSIMDVVDNELDKLMSALTPKRDVTATLILPMKASTDNVSRNNMDFYSGVLLAIKDLADTGVSTELNVYDSSDSDHPISREDIDGSDMIIGPVSSGDISRLLQSEMEPKMVISPLDPRAESNAYVHANFIQVPTPQSVLYKDLMTPCLETHCFS